jgi:hypothetical protein
MTDAVLGKALNPHGAPELITPRFLALSVRAEQPDARSNALTNPRPQTLCRITEVAHA